MRIKSALLWLLTAAALTGVGTWSGLLLTSCSDFLEADNKAGIDAQDYFETADGQVALRVTLYNSLRPMATNTDLTEYGTDLYLKTRTTDPSLMYTYQFDASNSSVRSYYTSAYTMINNANCMLLYGAGNALYEAEAKFIRAYGYYLLTQQFGAVPYVTHYIQDANKDYPRTPLADVYENIISELESLTADEALPAEDRSGNISRQAVKSLLAKVYLAAGWDLQTALTDAEEGSYTVASTDYFKKAASLAEEVIDGHELTMPFADKWAPANEGNEEEIFTVQYERAGYPGDVVTGGHNRQNTYGTSYGSPATNGLKSCGDLAPSLKSIRLWDKGDDRYEGTFMTTIYNYTGEWPKSGYYAYYNATETELASALIAEKYFPWYATTAEVTAFINEHRSQLKWPGCPARAHVHYIDNTSTVYFFKEDTGANDGNLSQDYLEFIKEGEGNTASVPCVKKFDDPATMQVDNGTGYRDIVLFHMSGMYLTAAEAQLMAGNTNRALELVNAVRARSHATRLASFADYKPNYTVSEAFGSLTPLDVVLDESARELYAETTRWMDLRRTRQLVRYNVAFNTYVKTVADMSNARGEVKWLRPIPSAEIETNTAISQDDQNPGY